MVNEQMHQQNSRRWSGMDTAATIFPATLSSSQTSLFRLSCTFTETINKTVMTAALRNVMPRFPYFQVEMKAGFFWYYFEPSGSSPSIEEDTIYPCMDFSIQKKGTLPFRVKVHKNRLAVEFSHTLTDGYGALIFLKALAAEYLASTGIKTDDWGDLFRKNGIPSNEEEDDSFLKHIPPNIPWPPIATEAFHLARLKMPRHVYRIITGIISISALHKKAAEFKVSSNDFLVSVALSACQDLEISKRTNKQTRGIPPIRILIPVNLRGLFPSKSMKNFILYVMPEIIPSLGRYSFEEILHRTHHYLKMEIDRKTFNRHIFRNVISTNNFFFRILPLKIKNLTLSFFSWFFGERAYTTSLSNLGSVSMPGAFANQIERFDFYPPPNDRTGVNCSVIGFKDTLSISFGSSLQDHSIERLFFCTLVKQGIKVKVETNIQGG